MTMTEEAPQATETPAPAKPKRTPKPKAEATTAVVTIIPIRGKVDAASLQGDFAAVEAVQTPWNKPATVVLAGIKLPLKKEVKIRHGKTGAGMGTWKTIAVPSGKVTVWRVVP